MYVCVFVGLDVFVPFYYTILFHLMWICVPAVWQAGMQATIIHSHHYNTLHFFSKANADKHFHIIDDSMPIDIVS